MPNWIEGTIKLRGSASDICKFLEEKINCYDFRFDSGEHVVVPREKWEFKIDDTWEDEYEVSWKHGMEPYIEGSRRAFITTSHGYFDNRDNTILTLGIKMAWSFTPDDAETGRWEQLSKETNLDIRLFGFECGMQFGQEIEIVKGLTTKKILLQYNDYEWECPFPMLGG